MADEAAVFAALADGTRRRVLEHLRDGGEHSVAELTGRLPVSQSAVSQHLRVLREAGLVTGRTSGTRHLYRVDRDGLSTLRAYVDRFWDDVLGAFSSYADGGDR
jgi:DNA-binding transcriptional ArsR family regulator